MSKEKLICQEQTCDNEIKKQRKYCSNDCYRKDRKRKNQLLDCHNLICEYCGVKFSSKNMDKCCSKDCSYKNRKRKNEIKGYKKYEPNFNCVFCGNPFFSHNKNAKYCSNTCKYSNMSKNLQKEKLLKLEKRKTLKEYQGNCPTCENHFLKKYETQKYCSQECVTKSLAKPKKLLICKVCDKEFTWKDSRKKTCSKECEYKLRIISTQFKSCLNCSKEVKIIKSRSDKAKFCSHNCYFEYKHKHPEKYYFSKPEHWVNCFQCSKKFYKCLAVQKENNKFNFCTIECMGKYFRENKTYTGKNNGTYVNGSSLIRRGDNYETQRKLIVNKYKKTCQNCNSFCGNGHVHHIVPFSMFSDYLLANRLENLILLCVDCHKKIHQTYNRPQFFKALYKENQQELFDFKVQYDNVLLNYLITNGLKLTENNIKKYKDKNIV